MEKFRKLALGQNILRAIEEANFTEPSEIQEKTIPLILEGKDVLGNSATGSGKTLAFGSGVIENGVRGSGVQSLILTPTRELAEQVGQNLRRFAKYTDLRIVEVYGGVSIGPQVDKISHAEIVVGTPGRILDHLERGTLKLPKVKCLVLDEADRMLDMGFIEDVERIVSACPAERQTPLFSATISKDIERLSRRYMKNPVYVEAESYVDASKLYQIYYDTPQNLKFSLLVKLLKTERDGLIMVFCNTRQNADMVANNLRRYDLDATAIHGGLNQNKRNSIMKAFHSGKALILVCTDVAARGLDIKNVSHVYNYDIPKNSEDYIHRIGRTARAGNEGKAVSLVSQRDYDNFTRVLQNDSLNIKNEPMPEVEQLYVKFEERRSGGRFGNRGGGRSGGRNTRGGDRGFGRGDSGPRRFGSRRSNFGRGGFGRR